MSSFLYDHNQYRQIKLLSTHIRILGDIEYFLVVIERNKQKKVYGLNLINTIDINFIVFLMLCNF